MNYRTTCPRCGSVFRLGEDQLKAADGWAQCGVCGENFDTHASLLLEDGSPLAAPIPTADRSSAKAASPEIGSVLPPATGPAPEVPRPEPDRLPSIILIDPDIPVPDDFGPLPEIPARRDAPRPSAPPPHGTAQDESPVAQIEYAAAGHVAPTDAPQVVPDEPPQGLTENAPRPDLTENDTAGEATGDDLLAEPPDDLADAAFTPYVPPRRKRTWAWAVASLVLLTLLAAQSAYFLRDPLVTHVPETRPVMERMCALLGCTLSLPKNLALLQIVGSDLETESAEHLTLTLTLGNRAATAQAWPVLVLTLTDQANRPLARRSFAPTEYLGDAGRVARGIPARSEQPLTLPLSVRDLKPMGFDLKLVY